MVLRIFVLSTMLLSWTQAFANSRELEIGPWLDLQSGGIAVGVAQSKADQSPGELRQGSLLPQNSPGLRTYKNPESRWGTGFMISLLTQSAAAFHAIHPDQMITVGAIAKEHGGIFSPHSSHQNGLDADVLFVGTDHYASVLDNGLVSDRFNPELNWEYWLSLTNQKISLGTRELPVVAAILVAPEIKSYLCAWAHQTGHRRPEDVDLLKRLRPTAGHDTHFHIRLQCSPYHTQCIQPWDPGLSTTTGCGLSEA